MDYHGVLGKVKADMDKENTVQLVLPHRFSFREHNVYEFEEALSFFNWGIRNKQVKIDITKCKSPNYQSLSLLVLYSWHLKNNGCTVSIIESSDSQGASAMWRSLGGRGAFPVLFNPGQTFKGGKFKPLIPVRSAEDFKRVIEEVDSYTSNFNIEYADTLRYVLSELLYNTLEHGKIFGGDNIRGRRIPSLAQFTWYKRSNEIQFIIADIGIGIKSHIEQAYPGQLSHIDAIRLAIKPQRSGTFANHDPYKDKNNAGMGLFISSNIIRRLNAEMHIVSGDGLLHISPRDVTGKTLSGEWPGTFVLVTLRLEDDPTFLLHSLLQEFREQASAEQKKADKQEELTRFYVGMANFFGRYAEDKEAAISFKEKHIFKAIEEDQDIVLDFAGVQSSPHSFLSALLASPIKRLNMRAYKKIKIVNATPEIRETIDFIFDDNTD